MDLRVERPDDRPAVRDVHRQAFGDHGPVVAAIVDELRASLRAGCGVSLVAERAGRVVGHVLFTRSLLDAPRRLVDVQLLSPLGVLPGWQGRGIGSALVRAGLKTAAEQSVPLVFLEGSPGYYARFGFSAAGPQGFRKPSLRIPDAAFQALRLPAYASWMTGTLVYPQTFWDHDAVGLRDGEAPQQRSG
jgi:putative acetyltransferase